MNATIDAADHIGLAHDIVMNYGYRRNDGEYDDVLQEVLAAFTRAAQLFDPERGFTFGAYAGRAAHNRIILYRRRKKRRERLPVTSSVTDCIVDDTPQIDPFAKEIWQLAERRLTPREMRVLELVYREGLTQEAAGAKLHISGQRVHQLHARIIAKMQNLLNVG